MRALSIWSYGQVTGYQSITHNSAIHMKINSYLYDYETNSTILCSSILTCSDSNYWLSGGGQNPRPSGGCSGNKTKENDMGRQLSECYV